MNVVLVAYTLEKGRAALDFCNGMLKKLPAGRRLIVLNRPELRSQLDHRGWEAIDGSNRFGEFSAWQEGLDFLGAESGSPVIFLNDTIVSHRFFSPFRRWAFVREAWCANPRCIVGFADHADNDAGDLWIRDKVLPGWVSSYLFLLGGEALGRLQHRLWEPEEVDACVRGGENEANFFTNAVSPDLQTQLRRWLFGGGWYQSEPLSVANAEKMARKARIICAEMLLSARCWAAGCGRHDPFERHPFARSMDSRMERWTRSLGFPKADWMNHPANWSRSSATGQGPIDLVCADPREPGSMI